MYYPGMKITWNPAKAASNHRKHGIRFPDAEAVLFDPMALTTEDERSEGERRFVSIGADAANRVLIAVYCYRGGGIRLISARRATRNERRVYEEGI